MQESPGAGVVGVRVGEAARACAIKVSARSAWRRRSWANGRTAVPILSPSFDSGSSQKMLLPPSPSFAW
ncbi:MAG: hypothetical protein M3Y50_00775, partial [Acidobacteriota bacterium]|nr:hypothetical protein [Acidobacteriota bacterium]